MLLAKDGLDIENELDTTGFLDNKHHKLLIKICTDLLIDLGMWSGYKK